MKYEDLKFKIPVESPTYRDDSSFVVESVMNILGNRMTSGENKITVSTSLKCGMPIENINKIAGPLIEAWVGETFADICDGKDNRYSLVDVQVQKRLSLADVILQFRKDGSAVVGNVDVKATSEDIPGSGTHPNITSFSRIRTAYVTDPDFIFIILSVNHRVYSRRNEKTGLVDGVMEITGYGAYDLKFVNEENIMYNPSLGTGQIQIQNIRDVKYQYRTTWEMCSLLDRKFLNSSRRSLDDYYREARRWGWITE